jgi:hypothetical protein
MQKRATAIFNHIFEVRTRKKNSEICGIISVHYGDKFVDHRQLEDEQNHLKGRG